MINSQNYGQTYLPESPNIYKSKSGEKYDSSVRKITKLGQSVEIRGKLSNTGKQLSPDKKRQYELENNNLVIYECIKKECKKNIITKRSRHTFGRHTSNPDNICPRLITFE